MENEKEANFPGLTETDLDRSLFDRDQRKPVRAIVDDYMMPAAGMGAGGALSLLKAFGNINRATPMQTIN